jgi:hypothetical protein
MTTVFKALQDALREVNTLRRELTELRRTNRIIIVQRDELLRQLHFKQAGVSDAETTDAIRAIAKRYAIDES